MFDFYKTICFIKMKNRRANLLIRTTVFFHKIKKTADAPESESAVKPTYYER